MAKKYVALMFDYLEEMEALSDAEFGRLCRLLLKYGITGKEEQATGNERFYLKRVYEQERRVREERREREGRNNYWRQRETRHS